MRAVHISGDIVGAPGGAGAVTKHEVMALKEVHGEDQVAVLQLPDVRPELYAHLDVPFLWDYFALSQLHERRFDDLKHAHIYSGCYSETIRYLKGRGVKTTYSCPAHDREASSNERRLRGVFGNLPHIDDPFLWDQHKLGLLLADLVIVPSSHSLQFLFREGVRRLKKIPHGINSIPETVHPFPEQFTVGYLGGLGPDKGIFYLIDAWGHLAYPDARLIIAGHDSQQLEDYIRMIAADGEFALLGYVENIADFYTAISVYCQPSTSEGFGLEILEAMSYGRPVIASEGAGASDLVAQGTGWRVPAGNTGQLMGAIRVARLESDLVGMGQRGREAAMEYTWSKIREEYVKAFREVLA